MLTCCFRTLWTPALAVALLLTPSVARTAPHYVDNAATGTSTGGSWSNAWKSFAGIDWSAVNAGDTIYISGGATTRTYSEQLTIAKSGVAGSPITIASGASSPSPTGHEGTVIIDGQIARPYCVSVASQSYVTVRDLKMINAAASGIKASGDHVIVEGNTLDKIRGQAIHFSQCNACVARLNVVTTLADDPAQTDGVVVYNGSDGVVVEGNHLVLTNQGKSHNDCVQSSECSNLTVRYNYCENLKDSELYANAQGIYMTLMSGTDKVYGNVVNLKQGAVGIGSSNLTAGTAKSVFVNNTVKCGSYRCIRVTEEADPIVKNNIVWQYRTAEGLYSIELRNWAGTAANIDGNLCFNQSSPGTNVNYLNTSARTWAQWQAQGLDANGANKDPSLDSCFRPDSPSDPSVGGGRVLVAEFGKALAMTLCPVSAATWTKSFATVERSVVGGSSWDVGAFEYGTAALVDAGPSTDRVVGDGVAGDARLRDGSPSESRGNIDTGSPSAAGGGCSCELGRAAVSTAAPVSLVLCTLLLLFRRSRRAARRPGHAATVGDDL